MMYFDLQGIASDKKGTDLFFCTATDELRSAYRYGLDRDHEASAETDLLRFRRSLDTSG